MDPSDPNYYQQYQPSQSQAPYGAGSTTSVAIMSTYGQPLSPDGQAYYPSQQHTYGASMAQFDPSVPTYQPVYGAHVAPQQPYPEPVPEPPPEFYLVPESERQKQIDKRKEQNRLAQRKFRNHNKAKAKELQEKLDNLRREFKDLKDNNENLKVEREELEERIQALTRENEDLKVSMGSSPESPSDTWWSFRADDEFPDPSNPGGAGSTSSYSGSHRSH